MFLFVTRDVSPLLISPVLSPQGPTGGKLGTQFWQPLRKQTGSFIQPQTPFSFTRPLPSSSCRPLNIVPPVPPGQGVFARDDMESVLWVLADIVWGGGYCIWKRVRFPRSFVFIFVFFMRCLRLAFSFLHRRFHTSSHR